MLKCEVKILDLAREEPDRIAFFENSESLTYARIESQNLDLAGAILRKTAFGEWSRAVT